MDPLPSQLRTPEADEAERYCVGCMLRGDEGTDSVRGLLAAGDFRQNAHQLVYAAAAAVRDSGRSVDLVSVRQWVKTAGKLGDLGSAEFPPTAEVFLVELYDEAPTNANLAYFAGLVRDAAVARRLIYLASEITRDTFDRIEPAVETAARFESLIAEAAADPSAEDPVTLAEAIGEGVADLRRRADRSTPRLWSGFAELDKILPGLDPGDLTVIGARPGAGKTALGLSIAINAGVVYRRPVYFVSLEMSRSQLGQRAAFMASGMSGHRFRAGQAGEEEIAELEEQAMKFVGSALLRIDDAPGLRIEQIASRARKVKRVGGLALVVVDYLQLVTPTNGREPRLQQVGHISRSLKRLAREVGAHVLALAQLNREVEKRTDPKPRLSDLREAGDIEQDADNVLFLWERAGQEEDAKVVNIGCVVAKQRNGPTGETELAYRRECVRFENADGLTVRA